MDEKFSESMSEEHFKNDTRESQDRGTGRMEEGQGRSDSQSGQRQGQDASDEMIRSEGPDELGVSLLGEELDKVGQKQVQSYKSPPPKVVISEVFNLGKLLEYINKCGRYRYIVVNATADKANVLIKTQNALFDVLKLCDATSLIVQNFQSGANNILEKLRVACLYLQDGFPDFAMADIESTSKDVAMMKERCEKTLAKVPGDDLPSMNETISKDYVESKSFLPEGITTDKSLDDQYSPETPMGGHGTDSSEMHDSFVAPDKMQESLEGIENISNENDQYARLVDEEKAKELKVMADVIEDQLEASPQSDSPAPEDETVYTSEGEMGISMIYVPPVEKVLEIISEDEAKRHYYPVTLMLRAINCVWMEVKDSYIIIVYKYLGYTEPLAITKPKEDEPQPLVAENNPKSVRRISDPDVLDKIDSYMRAKLTSVIVKIVKEMYGGIREVIRDALDLTEKWYKECKTLVEPVMKLNLEKTQGMSKEEQDKFWQTCDPEFETRANAYLDRWRKLQEYCEEHRSAIRKLRQTIEGYYIDNPYPREAIKKSWELAAKEEEEERIRKVVDEWKSYMPAEVVVGVE